MGRNCLDIDENVLLDGIESGITRKNLAELLGISVPTLKARLAYLQERQGLLLQYRAIQALQLTELQARVLEAITPDKIEEAPLKDLVSCYKILKDKELVVEGKPSEIKGLVQYLVHMEKEQMACEQAVVVSEKQETNDFSPRLPNL